jgi:hypothetical protein
MQTEFYSEKQMGRDDVRDLGVTGRTMFKWLLKE